MLTKFENEPDPRELMVELIQAGLGHAVDDETITKLLAMQETLQARQGDLANLLHEQKISRGIYIFECDESMKAAEAIGEVVLGFDDFHKVFGEFRMRSFGDDVDKFIAGDDADQI